MRKRCAPFVITLMLALVFGAFARLTAAVPQDNAQSTESKTWAEKCLACHGPFDKLAEKTKDFQASSGEKVTPHQYIPHADKKDVPECIECHQPHPVPLEDKSQVVKPDNVNWCYSGCHHASNLQPCKNCH